MWHIPFAVLVGSALAWFILVLIVLAAVIWLLSWWLFPETEPVEVGASLEGLTGMDEQMAGKLVPFGIRSDRDLIRLNPRGQQELQSQLGLHDGEYDRWRREVLAKWREKYLPPKFRDMPDITPSPELGGVYSRRPSQQDDLTKLEGVDKITASRLNNAGIYTFEQLRMMMPEQRACVKQKFGLHSFNFDSVPDYGVTAQWLAFQREGKSATTEDDILQPLPDEDESAPQATDAEILAPSFSSSQALNTATDAVESLESKTTQIDAPTTNADSATRAIPRSRDDDELGRVYTSPPPHRDDLTALGGVTAAIASDLNKAGVYTKDQLRSLSPKQQESFKRRFDLPEFDFSQWGHSEASGLVPKPHFGMPESNKDPTTNVGASLDNAVYASSSETPKMVAGFATGQASHVGATASSVPAVSSQDRSTPVTLATTYASPPEDADDLARLPHIDAPTAQRLNDAGIYKFGQLDSLSLEQQTRLRTQFGLAHVDFAEWRRLIFAWSRGIATDSQPQSKSEAKGALHTVQLPMVASGVYDGAQLVAYPEQVIFRGTEAEDWGKSLAPSGIGERMSVAASDIRTDINYVRIKRLDTRESVIVDVCKSQLFAPGPHDRSGWNGVCGEYFGARHLGVFAADISADVETKQGFGGWGFGHRDEQSGEQAYSWAGRIIPPTTFEISVGRVGPTVGTPVFRSNDPTIWNQRVRGTADHWSIPIADVTHPISFVRIMRTDTGDAVIVKTDEHNIVRRSQNQQVGWNGLNEHFYGGHHLGAYLQTAPQQVEIAYGEGGWGFGHPFDDNDRQGYGWAGQAIPETVFEISVLDKLPARLKSELQE